MAGAVERVVHPVQLVVSRTGSRAVGRARHSPGSRHLFRTSSKDRGAVVTVTVRSQRRRLRWFRVVGPTVATEAAIPVQWVEEPCEDHVTCRKWS